MTPNGRSLTLEKPQCNDYKDEAHKLVHDLLILTNPKIDQRSRKSVSAPAQLPVCEIIMHWVVFDYELFWVESPINSSGNGT